MTLSLPFLLLLAVTTALRLWLLQRQIGSVAGLRETVPTAFAGVIPPAAHRKAADYTLARARLAHGSVLADALLIVAWTVGGGLQWLIHAIAAVTSSPLHGGVLLILAFGLISAAVDLPFTIYRTFVIEARFGFNRTTVSTFLLDLAKGLVLTLLLATPLLYLLLWLLEVTGPWWWLLGWLAFTAFGVLLGWAFPTLIAPWFNRFTPLDDGALKTKIEDLLERAGFHASGVFVMDGSRRSSHGNAYFTGFGKHKRIVFYDTLLERLDDDEILAVLAHELGHFRRHHILKGLLLSAVTSLAGFALAAWLLPQPAFYHALGVTTPNPAAGLILFTLLLPLVTFYTDPLFSAWSRRHEFEADRDAAELTDGDALISALVKMYRDNASTLTPDPLYSLFHDSHPPAAIRIAALRRLDGGMTPAPQGAAS